MTESGIISNIIDEVKTKKQLEELLNGLAKVAESMDTINMKGGISLGQFTKEYEKLNTEKKNAQSIDQQIIAAKEKLNKLDTDEVQQLTALRQAYQEKLKTQKLSITAANEELGVYDKLNAKYKLAAKAALDAGGANKELNKTAQDFRTQLDKMGEVVGNHTQYVGWYEKAWNGVKSSWLAIIGVAATVWGALQSGMVAINNNIALHERWEIVTRQVQAGLIALEGTILSGDWTHLFTNIKTATDLAKLQVEQEEKLNFMQLQATITNAKARAEATRLYEVIFSTQDPEKRSEAVKKYMDLMKQIMVTDTGVAGQEKLNAELAYNAASTNLKLKADEALQLAKMKPEILEFYKTYNDEVVKNTERQQKGYAAGKVGFTEQTFMGNAILDNMRKTAGFSEATAEKVREFFLIGGPVEGHIPKVVADLAKYEVKVNDISTAYEQGTKSIQRYGANIDKQMKAAQDATEKAAAALLQKFNVGGLSEEYARELEAVKKTEAYKSLTVKQQEEVRFGIRKKYSDQVNKLVKDSFASLKKAAETEAKFEESANSGRIEDFIAGVSKIEKVDNSYWSERVKKIDEKLFHEDQAYAKTVENEIRLAEKAARLVTGSLNDMFGGLESSYELDLKKYEFNQEEKKKALDKQLKAGLISQLAYNNATTKLDDDLTAKKKESAKKQADVALGSAIVSAFANLATSLGGALAGAAVASSATGPLAPVTLLLYEAEEVLSVLGFFANVWNAINAAKSASYEKGREGGPAEFATVHPGELFEYQGKVAPTPSRPVTTFLPAGSSIIPAPDVRKMTMAGILNETQYTHTVSFGTEKLEREVMNLQKGFLYLGNVIEDKPELTLNITEKGLSKIVKRGNNYWEYRQRNVKL